jgi:predicted nucleic acid-binding protein
MKGELVDTNVLVYAHDRTAGRKRELARSLMDRLWRDGSGCLSIQVLQEFAVNVTRKIPQPLTLAETRDVIDLLSEWRVYSPVASDVAAALRRQEEQRVSFWDGMILQSAYRLGCQVLWSEDLNAGQSFDGVEVCSPFA